MKKLFSKKNVIKVLKPAGALALSAIIIFGLIKLGGFVKEKIKEANLNNTEWLKNNISLDIDEDLGDNIYSVSKHNDISIYNLKYQSIVNDKIDELLDDNDYTIDNPLLILNPYGTNTTGLNIYFSNDEEIVVKYTIETDAEDINDFSRTLSNNDIYSDINAYQIIGLVPENDNTINVEVLDKDENVINTKEIDINLSSIETKGQIKLEVEDRDSDAELSNGLYAVLGHDKSYNANTYLYDNDGILRGEIVLDSYRWDRLITYEDDIIYSYSTTGFARVNSLGKVVKEYPITGYIMHHDYILDEVDNKLLVLANKEGADTIEDIVISVDLESSKVEELIDFTGLLPEMYDNAIKPKGGNTYGGDELDWIHFNSLDKVNDTDIVLSSRELSTIIYISDLYENPTIKYMISDESTFDGTDYTDLLFEKIGDFTAQAGQHTITYLDDGDDNDSTYYLLMYNNNYQGARTRPDFDWSGYPGTGTYKEGTESMYYKYLVDEEAGTYELVDEVSLPYSSIVSSVQLIDGNYMTSSGMSHCFNEYDEDGTLIRQYTYTSKKYAYRVFKYTFNDYWFE